MTVRRAIRRLRRPEYTGENRCTPCTVLNVLLATLASGLIGLVSLPAMVGSFSLFTGLIYFRGYLIPETPRLTERYLSNEVLVRFEHGPKPATLPDDNGADGSLDIETLLREADIVVTCEDDKDVCLVPEFREAWRKRMEAVNPECESELIAGLLDSDPERLSLRHHELAVVATYDGQPVGQWESSAALVADAATSDELETRYDSWNDLSVDEHGRLLKVFRVFLEECPTCGGTVSLEQKEVKSCCRSFDIAASTCESCGARILEQELPE